MTDHPACCPEQPQPASKARSLAAEAELERLRGVLRRSTLESPVNEMPPASEAARAACRRAAEDLVEELALLSALLEGDRPVPAGPLAVLWDALQRSLLSLREAGLRLRQ